MMKEISQYYGAFILNTIKMIKDKCPNIYDYAAKEVEKSYIVPDSRKEIVKKGIKYGFNLDFESALGILIPQMENCIRKLAEICGGSRYKFEKNIENVNGVEYLLNSILQKSLDIDIYFGICAVFYNKFGLNYRNRFAHGLIDNFNDNIAVYVWWYCLYLICLYT